MNKVNNFQFARFKKNNKLFSGESFTNALGNVQTNYHRLERTTTPLAKIEKLPDGTMMYFITNNLHQRRFVIMK